MFTGSDKSHELGCDASRQWQVNRSRAKLPRSFTAQTRRSHHSDELAEVKSPVDEERYPLPLIRLPLSEWCGPDGDDTPTRVMVTLVSRAVYPQKTGHCGLSFFLGRWLADHALPMTKT